MSKEIKKPNLFIIGAPKCGTTSMAKYLGDHPDVFFSDPKELHYFCTDFSKEHKNKTSKKGYLKAFKGEENYKVLGEGSVDYLYSKEAIPKILEFNPDSKFIVMTRDPVEMFHSLHFQLLKTLDEDIQDPERAWRARKRRKEGELTPSTCIRPSLLLYGEVCKLGKQIERLLKTLPDEDKVKIIKLEELAESPKEVYENTLNFLEVESYRKADFSKYNKSKKLRFRNWGKFLHFTKKIFPGNMYKKLRKRSTVQYCRRKLKSWNKVRQAREPLSEEFEEELRDYFEKDQKLLEKILKTNRSQTKSKIN